MAAAGHVSRVRALYKRILVLHRFLPLDLRTLGDQYVKDEFRRHKGAAGGGVDGFLREWTNYKDTLQNQVLQNQVLQNQVLQNQVPDSSGGRFGVDLTERDLELFQDQQVGQLYELLLESTKPNRQFNVQQDGKRSAVNEDQ